MLSSSSQTLFDRFLPFKTKRASKALYIALIYRIRGRSHYDCHAHVSLLGPGKHRARGIVGGLRIVPLHDPTRLDLGKVNLLSQVCETFFQGVAFFIHCADRWHPRSSKPPPRPLPSYMHLDIQALAGADFGIWKRLQPHSHVGSIYTKPRIVD